MSKKRRYLTLVDLPAFYLAPPSPPPYAEPRQPAPPTLAPPPPAPTDLPAKVFAENNSYARTHFQALAGWFTFFLGANLLVYGWFVSKEIAAKPRLSVALCLFFISQNVVAVTACFVVRNNFTKVGRKVDDFIKSQGGDVSGSPFPHGFYSVVPLLMAITCITMLVFWVVLLFLRETG